MYWDITGRPPTQVDIQHAIQKYQQQPMHAAVKLPLSSLGRLQTATALGDLGWRAQLLLHATQQVDGNDN